MAEGQQPRYQLRPAQNLQSHIGLSQFPASPRRINFLHPAYERSQNVLFHMLAFDSPDGGLHHATARIACAIVAGNRWDGFFARNPTGPAIDASDDDLLKDSEYYFIIPGMVCFPSLVVYWSGITSSADGTYRSGPQSIYPIVPGFRHWKFPHRNLPQIWNEVDIRGSSDGRTGSDAVLVRDITCRMTACAEGCDNSHLCPQTERQWYQENRMEDYGEVISGGRQGINDPSNVMLLRTDLHRAWDNMRFVHTPKRSGTGNVEVVTHVLVHSNELGDLYHNTQLHQLGVARECLFARFAWTIFPLLSGFLQQGQDRYLLRAGSDDGQLVSADECFEHGDSWKPANQRSSRPPSPTKRPRPDAETAEMSGERSGPAVKRARQQSRSDTTTTTKDSCPQPQIPGLTTSQSTATDNNHLGSPKTVNASAKDHDALQALYDSAIASERERSDPDGRWRKHMEKEQQWLDGVLEGGGAVDPSEMPRLIRA
ncbi:MAG: hypothetical protein LQ348_006533 [Seirophora lacunosa]|nr:MAG: hypothetical protein LQ348_006533 [Seirophora lacunosa]